MWLEKSPIIAAVRTQEEFAKALASEVQAIFLLNASVLTLAEDLQKVHEKQKKAYVHLDLAEGVGKDAAGLTFLKNLGADGVISTRNSIVRTARELGLSTVQRFFIVDSHSIATAADSIRTSMPEMVELMPGIVPKVLERFCGIATVPVIAGGLIETKKEIIQAINAGATAVSTGCAALWNE